IQSIATSCSDLEAKIKAGKQPRPPQAAADRCPEDAPTKNISVIISGPAGAVKKGGSPVSFTASPSDGGSYSFDWTVARKGGGSKKSDNHTKTLTLNPTQEGDFIITVELLRRCRNGKTVKLSSSYPLKVEAGGSGNCDLICNEDADVKKGKLTSGRCSEICRECAGRSDFANCMYFKKKVKKMDPEEARKLHESFGGK
ncbi:MAG TPA: hypothetical protein VN328_00895, partial [Thermodesulfovibrionales bacterium]|nr:hypothetical protein [Thermodesulfovibrionales bacterium]